MKKILVISATQFEINPTYNYFFELTKKSAKKNQLKNVKLNFQVTGVGMVNTAFSIGKLNHKLVDLAINAGIAGSFGNHKIGSIVNVTHDCFSELGAENNKKFIPIEELGFGNQQVEIQKKNVNSVLKKIPIATGITVNTIHGNANSIKKIIDFYHPDVETMEGAAFIECANKNKWQSIQLRAISNYVEKRNTNNWNIPLAIKKLNKKLIELILSIEHSK
jgi:futalosine hydrolase